jgi:hypothetical protein
MYSVHQGKLPFSLAGMVKENRTWRTKLRNTVRSRYKTITTVQRPTVLQGHQREMICNHSVAESTSKGKQGSGQGCTNCAEHTDELLDGEGAEQKFQHEDLGLQTEDGTGCLLRRCCAKTSQCRKW